jgi:NTP pyrophosphatase (non-canonical NTP hydrolase)
MNADIYQQLASRTRCPQDEVLEAFESTPFAHKQTKGVSLTVRPPVDSGAMLLHGVLGLTGEVGELAGAVERYGWYKQDFDRTNVIEELGDALWYIGEICDALGIRMSQVMDLNIKKLCKRYPEKFNHLQAQEENRDRAGEAGVLAQEESSMPLIEYIERCKDDGVTYPE